MGIASLKSCTDFYRLRVLGVYLDKVLIRKGRFITPNLMLQRFVKCMHIKYKTVTCVYNIEFEMSFLHIYGSFKVLLSIKYNIILKSNSFSVV